jgi:hypothetical protein
MTLPDGVRRLFRLPATARGAAADVDEELRFHLETRVQELVAAGHTPADAERLAAREFGDVRAARAELTAIDRARIRQVGRAEWWASWWQDVRFAARTLRRAPGLAMAVLLTLALGVGTTGAVFTVADAALLRPLPYAEPSGSCTSGGRTSRRPTRRATSPTPTSSSCGPVPARCAASPATTATGWCSPRATSRATGRGRRAPTSSPCSACGRHSGGCSSQARTRRGGRIVVLSHALWTRQFAGDPGIVGRTVQLDGGAYTVVGVLPTAFQFAPVGDADVWVPFDRPAEWRERRSMSWFRVVARLRRASRPRRRRARSAPRRRARPRAPARELRGGRARSCRSSARCAGSSDRCSSRCSARRGSCS